MTISNRFAIVMVVFGVILIASMVILILFGPRRKTAGSITSKLNDVDGVVNNTTIASYIY